jgi:DNA polymerase-3 subunit epsilon
VKALAPRLPVTAHDAPGSGRAPLAVQQSFDALGTPLADVTFVVLDLETTGASAADCAITEVGAVRYRGGERIGTFQTLVNPGVPIPPTITVITGITEAMVMPAPPIEEVLPAFLEFIGGAVIVGHNVRFDISFLDAALDRAGYPKLANRRVDTLGLARRLVRDEVPDLKLGTLARHLRVPMTPCHRAFEDAQATAEVLHALLERAGTLGVLGLDDLLELPTIRAHPSASKLRLTAGLPREPGVYVFRDRTGQVLYVGKATNLRARVRSYFGGDDRRKVPQLLRETERIDHIRCDDPLEAEIHELRLIRRHEPRYNRVGKGWRSYAYLKLTVAERFPRLTVVTEARPDGSVYLGPFRSRRSATAVKEAIEAAVPLRRCTDRIARHAPITCDTPCAPAQLGVAACPCRGETAEDDYRAIVERAVVALRSDHRALLDPLEARMATQSDQERFEEAAATRDRLATLSRALRRVRTIEWLRAAGRLRVETPAGVREFDGGHLCIASTPMLAGLESEPGRAVSTPLPLGQPPARDEIDELLAVARWLDKEFDAGRVRLLEATGCAASACSGPLPAYAPVSRGGMRRGR